NRGEKQYPELFVSATEFDDFTRVGLTVHLRKRLKSESICLLSPTHSQEDKPPPPEN
ncbi:hypothetical protein A2U01_0050403, partial [Trifolium medium]|nr:hypothetical protein [Trifolium medium]